MVEQCAMDFLGRFRDKDADSPDKFVVKHCTSNNFTHSREICFSLRISVRHVVS
jgi:hypothetical protein